MTSGVEQSSGFNGGAATLNFWVTVSNTNALITDLVRMIMLYLFIYGETNAFIVVVVQCRAFGVASLRSSVFVQYCVVSRDDVGNGWAVELNWGLSTTKVTFPALMGTFDWQMVAIDYVQIGFVRLDCFSICGSADMIAIGFCLLTLCRTNRALFIRLNVMTKVAMVLHAVVIMMQGIVGGLMHSWPDVQLVPRKRVVLYFYLND